MSSVSHFGTWRSTPGIASGTQDPELNAPALPKEQLMPGATGSSTVTLAPNRCK